MGSMSTRTYLVRVVLRDRPGALGVVTSRLGALKGDVLGIEILDRSDGFATDELLVRIPSAVSVDLITREVSADEGVEVECIERLEDTNYDPDLDVLEAARRIVTATSYEEMASLLSRDACKLFGASWASVETTDGLIGWSGDSGSSRESNSVQFPLADALGTLTISRNKRFLGAEEDRVRALVAVVDACCARIAVMAPGAA